MEKYITCNCWIIPPSNHLLENSLKLLKALSLHGPWPYEKEYGKSGCVKDVDAPGVKEEDVPEVGEAGSAEDAHKTLKREDFLDHDEGASCHLCDPLPDKDLASVRKDLSAF